MKHLKPFLQDPLPKTILPLTISLGCFLIERTLPNILKGSLAESENSDPPFLMWSKWLKETIIGAYCNYTQFIVMMLVFSMMISIIRANFQGLLKRNEEKRQLALNEQHRGIKQALIWFCKCMIYYTILFCCYQAVFLMWNSMLGRHQSFTIKTKLNGVELEQYPSPSLRRLEEVSKEPIYISDENHFAVYSPLKNSVATVMIELDKQSSPISVFQPYFMDKKYNQEIQVKNQKSSITLEGGLEKVNQALQEVLIDLVGFPAWGGTISVKYKNNSPAPFRAYFKNISDYLMVNNLSIYISNENRLVASSLDNKPLLATIQMELFNAYVTSPKQPFFMNQNYSSQQVSFGDRNTLISIKGSLEEVNQVLKEILIHADQREECEGTIKITDGFNVPVSQSFTNIFAYAKTMNESITIRGNQLFISTTIEEIAVVIELDKDEIPVSQPSFMEGAAFLSTVNNGGSSISWGTDKRDINKELPQIVLDLNGHLSWGGTVKFKKAKPWGNNEPFPESRYFNDISKYCVIKKEPIYVSAENHLSVFSHKPKKDLTLTIQFDERSNGLQPYFLNKTYPSLKGSNQRSVITLTGPMARINQALGEEILVDLAGLSVCGGTISIQTIDQVVNRFEEVEGPTSSLYFQNISDFFTKSQISVSISNDDNQLTVASSGTNPLSVFIDLFSIESISPPLSLPGYSVYEWRQRRKEDFNKKFPLQPHFISKEYPSFPDLKVTNKKYQMIFEGSPDKINLALREILIDLAGLPTWNGTINVTDKVNPVVVSYPLPNISSYLPESKTSIYISNQNSLAVSSLFNNHALVNIQLDRTKTSGLQPYFMDKEYLGLKVTNNKYHITLEGPPDQINNALKEMLIDPSGFPTWGGTINITDGVNPTVSSYLQNVSNYLTHNNLSIYIDQDEDKNNRFAISSRENNTVLVTLQIDTIPNKPRSFQPCLLKSSKSYPNVQIENIIDRSLMTFEGSAAAINNALLEILIDTSGMNVFGGTINVTDGVNPLVSHYFSNILRFLVKTRLSILLSNENRIAISALNYYQKVVVTIKLDLSEAKNRKPYFVNKIYPSLKVTTANLRSIMTLEGSLDDINRAFKEIFIYLDELSVCSGEITVTAGSYYWITRPIKDLSTYLIIQKEVIYISPDDNRLAISSMSPDPITVTLQLNFNTSIQKQAQFVSKPYPSVKLDNRGYTMSLEGLPDYVNSALKEILVALDDQLTTCSGTVSIKDGDNPYTYRSFDGISNYFVSNIQPFYNSSFPALQEQIDNCSLYTGKFSSIALNPNTFNDKYGLPLQYSLLMQDRHQELPSWITLKGLTLSVTPPEKYYPLSYQLVLVVENEAKQLKVPFTVNVKISLTYGAKVIATYCGYLLTLLGSVIYANRVFNIVAKKYYRYPSTFKLTIGESITNKTIFPISFIEGERKESKFILKKLEEYAVKQRKTSKPQVGEEIRELNYFIDSHKKIMDKQKILQTITTIIPTLPLDKLKLYNDQTDLSSKEIINQLILNEMVMRQLALKESKTTKDVFNKIKNNWMSLVTATDSPSQFEINSNLDQQLLQICSAEKEAGDNGDLERKLLSNGYQYESKDIQMDLLKDAIIAHAFDFQNLNIKTIKVSVTSYQRIQEDSFIVKIKGIFLKDLSPIDYLNKREIGCGIEYAIKKNTLDFFGTPNTDMKEKVIVVHIKTKKGRILRELSLAEIETESVDATIIDNVQEEL